MSAIQLLYYVATLYSLIYLVLQNRLSKRFVNRTYLYLLVSVLLANCGVAWMAMSNSIDEALVSMKVNYLGSVPLCYFSFMFIAETCNINFHSWFKTLLGIIATVIVALSMTIGYSDLFYKSAELIVEDGYSYVTKVYGTTHILYVIVVFGYMIGSLGAALYSLLRPSLVARLLAFTLALTQAGCILVYFLERHFKFKYELMPFAYCLTITFFEIVLRKLYLYDADRVADAIRTSNRDSAVILFDKNKRYIGNNETAGILFPETELYYVERVIDEKYKGKEYFEGLIDSYEQAIQKVDEPNARFISLDNYHLGNNIYNARVGRLVNETVSGDRGYIIEFVDDTMTQNYIKTINDMNVELEKAANEARAASEAKSRFLASMSHEIRTPINAVLGFNSIILRDTKENATREYASDIDRSGKALLSLINDILDFSKVEAGRLDISPVEYKLESLISDCQGMMYGRFKEKGLGFVVECDEKCPAVLYGDEIRVRQVVINLLTNAYKYTEKGSVKLSVSCLPINDEETTLNIRVDDTGIGISAENQKHLFEQFTRVDVERNRNIEGTGLGLALVQRLTNLMGGHISVTSKLGEGSSFIFDVPQKIISNEPIGKNKFQYERKEQSVKMDELSDTLGTVLVVDDVKTNLKVFEMMLSKSKLTIDTALSGAEALEKLKQKKYDIVFLDHMMPEMDGIETLHKMREDDSAINVETPVVMLTANAIEGVKEQYFEEGFDDYLSKPVNFMILKDTILKFIG